MRIRTDRSQCRRFISDHELNLRGEKITYRAVAESTMLEHEDGRPISELFSFTYLRTDENRPDRPVLFAFNGGPGSSSVWMHLGLLGPRRVKMDCAVNPNPLMPYELEDNPHCLLDLCDLVLIDSTGTGYARLSDEAAAPLLYSICGDAESMALFIEDWLNRYDRHNSPRFLAGESYGTIRACLLTRELMGGPTTACRRLCALPVNGLILLGTSIMLPMLQNNPPVWPQILMLLSYSAVHHYHHPEGKPPLFAFVEEAWRFASQDYLLALFAGRSLSPDKRRLICSRLSDLTGIEADVFDRHELLLDDLTFRTNVLKKEGLDVGAYDGRYTLPHQEMKTLIDPVADDPAMGQYTPAYIGAMNAALKSELSIELDRVYRAIDFSVNALWNYETPVTPTDALALAMRRNPHMAVFFGSGLYDLVTPAGVVRYLVRHLDLPQDKVVLREYASGHMPYLGEESAFALEKDLRSFLLNKSCSEEQRGLR